MDVTVRVLDDESGEGLQDLRDWLGQESDLRGKVTSVRIEPTAGQLGAGSDALTLAVGAGGAVSVLAASLKSFFAQPRRSDITITVSGKDGSSIEIDARRVKDAHALVSRVLGGGE